jgi:ATP-binding cassette subfamily B (MDR/TAP) protein 1
MYSVLACYFWAGAEIVVYYKGAIDAKNVFAVIFILMNGTMGAGGAAAQAPDAGRANASVDKVYDVLNHESTIDAMADEHDKEKVRLDLTKIKGEIEFEDVWFRYPTRKEDFVLRGLNLKINPS